jgi:hypothetical protein
LGVCRKDDFTPEVRCYNEQTCTYASYKNKDICFDANGDLQLECVGNGSKDCYDTLTKSRPNPVYIWHQTCDK